MQNQKLKIIWENIDPLSSKDISEIFFALDSQYNKYIDLMKLPIKSEHKKFHISKIETGSLRVELSSWFTQCTQTIMPFMENANTVIGFTEYFLRFIFVTKKDAIESQKIITANSNSSDDKSINLEISNGNLVINNYYYDSQKIKEISSLCDEKIQEQESKSVNNNESDYEYGDPIEITGEIVGFNWDTYRGEIRTKLFGASRAKKYDYYFMNPEEIPEQFTKYISIKTKAIPVYKQDRIIKLELRDVEIL